MRPIMLFAYVNRSKSSLLIKHNAKTDRVLYIREGGEGRGRGGKRVSKMFDPATAEERWDVKFQKRSWRRSFGADRIDFPRAPIDLNPRTRRTIQYTGGHLPYQLTRANV